MDESPEPMTTFDHIKLPPPRTNTRRVTPAMKLIKPGQSMLIDDEPTARSFYAWIKRRGTGSWEKQAKGGWRVGMVSRNPLDPKSQT